MTSRRRLLYIAILSVATIVLRLIYSSWAVDAYAYQGYTSISHTVGSMTIQAVLVICTALLMPLGIERPSDFFRLFYSWFVLFPFAIFYFITGYVETLAATVLYLILALPCLLIGRLRNIRVNIPAARFLPEQLLVVIVATVSVLVFVTVYSRGIIFSFALDEMYERRLLGRDVIGSRNLLAYAFVTTLNGFVPLLALLGGYRRSLLLGGLSLLIALSGFAAIGAKSPTAVSMLFFALGWLQSRRIGDRLAVWFSWLVVSISLAAFFLIYAMGNSVLADILIRRSFFVPAANLGFYWDVISKFSLEQLLVSGHRDHMPITFYVGEHYYANSATNVNISAFLLALADGGVFWYAISIAAVGAFFAAVDGQYKRSGHAGYMVLGAMYGLLITEQAWTTAAISSGALLLFVLLSVVRMDKAGIRRVGTRPSIHARTW